VQDGRLLLPCRFPSGIVGPTCNLLLVGPAQGAQADGGGGARPGWRPSTTMLLEGKLANLRQRGFDEGRRARGASTIHPSANIFSPARCPTPSRCASSASHFLECIRTGAASALGRPQRPAGRCGCSSGCSSPLDGQGRGPWGRPEDFWPAESAARRSRPCPRGRALLLLPERPPRLRARRPRAGPARAMRHGVSRSITQEILIGEVERSSSMFTPIAGEHAEGPFAATTRGASASPAPNDRETLAHLLVPCASPAKASPVSGPSAAQGHSRSSRGTVKEISRQATGRDGLRSCNDHVRRSRSPPGERVSKMRAAAPGFVRQRRRGREPRFGGSNA